MLSLFSVGRCHFKGEKAETGEDIVDGFLSFIMEFLFFSTNFL